MLHWWTKDKPTPKFVIVTLCDMLSNSCMHRPLHIHPQQAWLQWVREGCRKWGDHNLMNKRSMSMKQQVHCVWFNNPCRFLQNCCCCIDNYLVILHFLHVSIWQVLDNYLCCVVLARYIIVFTHPTLLTCLVHTCIWCNVTHRLALCIRMCVLQLGLWLVFCYILLCYFLWCAAGKSTDCDTY